MVNSGDPEELVTRADLVYRASAPGMGLPLGNGRINALVQVSSRLLQIQLSRQDPASSARRADSKPWPGISVWIALDPQDDTLQPEAIGELRLAVYDAECRLQAGGLNVRCFVAAEQDLLALEIEDTRPAPHPVRISLAPGAQAMLSADGLQFATPGNGVLALAQAAPAGGWQATACQLVGRDVVIEAINGHARALAVAPGEGRCLLLVAHAAATVAAGATGQAMRLLERAAGQSYGDLRRGHVAWWHAYWQRTVPVGSAGETPAYLLCLYTLAAAAGGTLPAPGTAERLAPTPAERQPAAAVAPPTHEAPPAAPAPIAPARPREPHEPVAKGAHDWRTIPALLILAARRLISNAGLMAGLGIGLIVAVALVMCVPIYAEGINYRVLRQALSTQEAGRKHPPFSFRFRYAGYLHGAISWEDYQQADDYLKQMPSLIGLPLESTTRHVTTAPFQWFPAGRSPSTEATGIVMVGMLTGVEEKAVLVEGSWPDPHAGGDATLQVIVSEALANEVGVVIGEELELVSVSQKDLSFRGRVVGIWKPRDPADMYWYQNPANLDTVFLVSENAFASQVASQMKTPVYQAEWNIVLNGDGIHVEDLPSFLQRLVTTRTQANVRQQDVELEISPEKVIRSYINTSTTLTLLLYVFTIPIIGVIIYFLVATASQAVQRQRNEIAVLRSRGTSRQQVIGLYLLEGLLLGAIAIVIGPLLAGGLARALGQVRSFLTFAHNPPLTVNYSQLSVRAGLVAVLASIFASLLPAFGATRFTIVSYKQDVARSLQVPWWQRSFVDLALLAVSLYGYFLLRQQGVVAFLGQKINGKEGDPFQNPLLFLAPALFVFALSLVFARVFPLVMEGLARLAQLFRNVSAVLALRQLARARRQYVGPLLLTVLTLGLACFTASMALTLDRGLVDQTYYDVGADMRLRESGDPGLQQAAGFPVEGSSQIVATKKGEEYWTFIPVSEHLNVKGVRAAARFGAYKASAQTATGGVVSTVVGVDRADFAQVAYFRRDVAGISLGAMLNRLAVDDSAVIVPTGFAREQGLSVGDTIKLSIVIENETYDVPFTVAGFSGFFPTIYEEDGPFFVTNLEYIYESVGGTYPYDVLLRTDPSVPSEQILADLHEIGITILASKDARGLIASERQRPERQGMLGVLSVGFVASALLTVLGYLYYSFTSFQRRTIELGILRAMGLSVRQLTASLAFEQLALIVSGVGIGTGLGVLASRLFIPFLRVQGARSAQALPYVVRIDWGSIGLIYGIFGALLAGAIGGLVWLLSRVRIAEAVKIGETA